MTSTLPPLRVLVIPSNAVFYTDPPLQLLALDRSDFAAYYQAVHDLVGGTFEAVRGPKGAFFYVNDEGKFLGLPENILATTLVHEAESISVADFIAGQVVVIGAADDDGEDTDVPDGFVVLLKELGCQVNEP